MTLIKLPVSATVQGLAGPWGRSQGATCRGRWGGGCVCCALSCFLGGPRTLPRFRAEFHAFVIVTGQGPSAKGGRRPSKPSTLSLAEVRGHRDSRGRTKDPAAPAGPLQNCGVPPWRLPGVGRTSALQGLRAGKSRSPRWLSAPPHASPPPSNPPTVRVLTLQRKLSASTGSCVRSTQVISLLSHTQWETPQGEGHRASFLEFCSPHPPPSWFSAPVERFLVL